MKAAIIIVVVVLAGVCIATAVSGYATEAGILGGVASTLGMWLFGRRKVQPRAPTSLPVDEAVVAERAAIEARRTANREALKHPIDESPKAVEDMLREVEKK